MIKFSPYSGNETTISTNPNTAKNIDSKVVRKIQKAKTLKVTHTTSNSTSTSSINPNNNTVKNNLSKKVPETTKNEGIQRKFSLERLGGKRSVSKGKSNNNSQNQSKNTSINQSELTILTSNLFATNSNNKENSSSNGQNQNSSFKKEKSTFVQKKNINLNVGNEKTLNKKPSATKPAKIQFVKMDKNAINTAKSNSRKISFEEKPSSFSRQSSKLDGSMTANSQLPPKEEININTLRIITGILDFIFCSPPSFSSSVRSPFILL